MSNDYVPTRDADFDHWLKNLSAFVEGKTSGPSPAWGGVPAGEVEALTAAYEDWSLHYGRTLQPHAPSLTTAKNDARRRAEAVVRLFVRRFLHFPPVTNAERVDMGIPNRDAVRTEHHEVSELLEMTLAVSAIREVRVRVKIKGADHNAKPKGYDGAVLVWMPLDSPPADVGALTRHAMASRATHVLRFEEAERGKTVYVAGAWQNERGNLGAWSEILSAIVP